MCCGEYEEIAMAKTIEPTAEVYTTTPGDVRMIGGYGEASNDTPAVVPVDVAEALVRGGRFRLAARFAHHVKGELVHMELGEAMEPEEKPTKKARKGQEE